jgi:uncharacterized membrane protein
MGVSCGEVACRAFLWDNGVMYNLNKLMGATFTDSLVSAQDISDDGTITGRLLELSTGKGLAFVATPRHRRR